MTRAALLLLALACCTPSPNRRTTNGDASMPDATDDATTNSPDGSADAQDDAPTLTPGTWPWADAATRDGLYARRGSWPNGSLVRWNGANLQLSTTNGAAWFASTWTPSTDDQNATDWSTRAP